MPDPTPTRPALALLGTGLMGRPMAERLLAAGFPVAVWNRSAERARPLAEDGATIALDPADAIRAAEAVILMLADEPAIRQTLLAVAPAEAVAGRTVIQMGTIAPGESLALAQELEGLGAAYLEAPVLGSIPEARDGRLLIMVGADPTAFERWLPVLEVMGATPRLVGPVGRAAALKLALNQLIAVITTAYSTVLGIVRRSEVDLELWAEIVRASALCAPTFDKKLPRMIDRTFEPANFPVRHLLKDVRLAAAEAARLGLLAPHLDAIAEILERALAAGLGDCDYSAVAAAVEPPGEAPSER